MRTIATVALALITAGCASTPVNKSVARRVVGTENDVRIDAEVYGEQLSAAINVPVKYEITNNRSSMIAVADMVPETSFDPDTQTVTLSIGSEVPGATLLPRLIPIAPGQSRTFSAAAHVNILLADTPFRRPPSGLRVKLSFLGDVSRFEKLIGIPEKGVYDPKMADELFPVWLERNETVFTNTLPMRWTVEPADLTGARRGRG